MGASAPMTHDVAATRSGRALRALILGLGLVLIVAFTANAFYDVNRTLQQTLVAQNRDLTNLAHALAENVRSNLQTVDLLLRDTGEWYLAEAADSGPHAVLSELQARIAGLRPVLALKVIDAAGVVRFSTLHEGTVAKEAADAPFFAAQRDPSKRGLYVSDPLPAPERGRFVIVVSRPLLSAARRFEGVIVAILDVGAFEQTLRNIDLGPGSAVRLVDDDGVLVASHPAVRDSVGKIIPELLAVRREADEKEIVRRVTIPFERAPRFIATASVHGFPMFVAVSRKEDDVLAAWRDEAISIAVRTVSVALLTALLAAALLRELKRRAEGERRLRDSEERYALAMEGSDEGHWDWHIDDDQLFLSPRMKTLHAEAADAPVATHDTWWAGLPIEPADRAASDAAMREHLAGRTPAYDVEYRVRGPNGDWRWLQCRGRCLRRADGTPYRMTGSVIDISARKRADEERAELEAQLRQAQKVEALGTLAGGIAHDFNNILGAILGYGEMAQRTVAEDGPVRRYVDQILQAGNRAKALVERILAFSRSGMAARIPVHVQAVVDETLDLLAPTLPPSIRLVRQLNVGDAAVVGDPTQLHQLVMNLATNAVHAMSAGGTLEVTLSREQVEETRALSHGRVMPGEYVRIVVADNGVGIPRDVQERMFDPFFTTKPVGEGTGLGLSLVHGIVTDLGGVIDVRTDARRGTTFAIWLPRAGITTRPAESREPTLPRGDGETVLVVDDEETLVRLAEDSLAELGYEPVGFTSSRRALAAFHADPLRFDAVVADETMPDVTGSAVAAEIHHVRPTIPILLVSGFSGPALAGRAQRAGVVEVLHKPLRHRELALALARALHGHGAQPSLLAKR